MAGPQYYRDRHEDPQSDVLLQPWLRESSDIKFSESPFAEHGGEHLHPFGPFTPLALPCVVGVPVNTGRSTAAVGTLLGSCIQQQARPYRISPLTST